jgi:stalled ribosome alternative rescue factor ArfA
MKKVLVFNSRTGIITSVTMKYWRKEMKRNPIAKDFRTSKYRMQIVKAKKGNGSYDRKKYIDFKEKAA